MTPELSRPIDVGTVSAAGLDVTVEADARECRALAARMDIPAVRSLRCVFHLTTEADHGTLARGLLRAEVVQTCVVSLEDFATVVEERFAVRFVPSGMESEDDDPDSIDEIPFEGHLIDLGEAAAEQLGLALDPYPRKPGASMPDTGSEADANHPFAALSIFRQKE